MQARFAHPLLPIAAGLVLAGAANAGPAVFDAEGRRLGGDAIVTCSFVDPDAVVASTLTVPLVATSDGGAPPDLRDVEWDCLYGTEPCEVIGAGKLGDNVDGLARDGVMRGARDPMVERPPVFLEVLVDVSPSVWANRIEQMTSIYHVSAHLLLHGDEDDQRAALSTIEEIWEIDPILVRRLRPALRTFQTMNPPRKLRLKAERLADPAPRTSLTRPDQQG